MRRIAVHIGTTAGPVRIERIIHEPSAREAMVCLGRTSRLLPISADYDSFVRPGSGPVARAFGPFPDGGFRLDLSDALQSGNSWQLAVFVAHAVAANPETVLAPSDDEADEALWLCGEVDYDYAVRPVSHMAEKVHASRSFFDAWQASGRPLAIVVPAGQGDALDGPGKPASSPSCRAIASAADFCDELRLTDFAPSPVSKPSRALSARTLAIAGLAAAVLAGAGYGLTSAYRGQMRDAEASTPVPPLHVEVRERRAPDGKNCTEVLFGGAEPRNVTTVLEVPSASISSAAPGLCGVDLVFSPSGAAIVARAGLTVKAGRFLGGIEPPQALQGGTRLSEKVVWSLDLPRRLPDGLDYTLKVQALPEGGNGAARTITLHHVAQR